MRGLPGPSLIVLAFCVAGLHAGPVEAADGYYNGLKLPYPAGEARVVVRVSEHGPGRHAVDFGMSYEDVLAMYAGQVAWTGKGHALYGNYIVVDHLDNYCSLYAHFDRLYVRSGQPVQQGERLGRSGNTGQSTGSHLHAAVFRKASGACGPANAWTEVMMLFDEGPRRELRAGDWFVSRNGRPVAPYYPSVDGITDHSLNVRWNDYSNNEQGFKVERRPGTGSWAQVAALAENSVRYVDDGLSPASSYCYRVRSFNGLGDSTYSNIACARTALSTGNPVSSANAVPSAAVPMPAANAASSTAIPVSPPSESPPPPLAGITVDPDDDARRDVHVSDFPDAAATGSGIVPNVPAEPLVSIWDSVLGWLRPGESQAP